MSVYPFPAVGDCVNLSPCLIPYKPEASDAAIARYGLTSAPITLVSNLHDFSDPTNARKAVVLLSIPHVNVVGAQAPSTNRL